MNKSKIILFLLAPAMVMILLLSTNGRDNKKIMTHEINTENSHSEKTGLETATLGGGCFWCLEAIYEKLRGVKEVVSGYSGGTVANPSYEAVCTGTTGHAEVCRITFDPSVITYRELLEVFFDIHDPTSLNRQGADIGTQYRSVIFYHTPEQKKTARDLISQLTETHQYNKPIVTQVEPFQAFYKAEDYHQNYFVNNPNQPYCAIVISPKVKKFEKQYGKHLKKK